MRRKSTETRQHIIDAAYTLFYQNGFMRTNVDAIADEAGITKRTLYQYFNCKDDLIQAVLEDQHQIALERIRLWADCIQGNPEEMVRTLFEKLFKWAAQTEWRGSGFTRAAIEFVDLPGHPARTAARQQKERVERILVDKFAAQKIGHTEQFVREIMVLIEGCQSLALIHDDLNYVNAARHAALILVQHYQSP